LFMQYIKHIYSMNWILLNKKNYYYTLDLLNTMPLYQRKNPPIGELLEVTSVKFMILSSNGFYQYYQNLIFMKKHVFRQNAPMNILQLKKSMLNKVAGKHLLVIKLERKKVRCMKNSNYPLKPLLQKEKQDHRRDEPRENS